MEIKMRGLVIFDLDGTLLDTLGDLADAVNAAITELGRPARTTDEVRGFIGNGTKRLIEGALGDGADDSTVEKCLAIFKAHYGGNYAVRTYAYEGVADSIAKLRAVGVTCGVITNKLHGISLSLCEKYFPGAFVEVIGDTPDMKRKPDPQKVYKMLSDLGFDTAVFVGDSDVDVKTAHNAGLPCVAVSWGFNDKEQLLAAGAEIIADNAEQMLDEILTILTKNQEC